MTLQDTKPRKRRRKPVGESTPATATLLAHPAVDRILESATRTAAELAKLNAAMDKLMVATGDGVIPAVRVLADRLISFLDAAAGWDECEEDGDEEDDDGDLKESSLSVPENMNQSWAWKQIADACYLRDDGEIDLGTPDRLMDQTFRNSTFGHRDDNREGDELDTREACELEINGEDDELSHGERSDDDIEGCLAEAYEGCETEEGVPLMNGGDRNGDAH